jgi:hypothetical protein
MIAVVPLLVMILVLGIIFYLAKRSAYQHK